MTRINTNVSALVAGNTLGRSNSALEQALTRLSTGLRINTGKDDPAGLIASENLRSDITSINKAISNTGRANQVISTADSALGQVSSLLNDIRGLVTESANGGALSQAQIDANQLQIDQSLKALNRIAQTTTFQGRKLLDGSLDFTVNNGTNFTQLSDLQIDQANLGTAGSLSVDVSVTTAAAQAEVDVTGFAAATSAANATTSFSLSHTVAQATGTVSVNSAGPGTIAVTAKSTGTAAGAEGNGNLSITIVDGVTAGTAYNTGTNTLTVTLDITGGSNTVAALASVINAGTHFATGAVTNGTDTITATNTGTGTLAGGRDAGSATIQVTADTAGTAANGVTVSFSEGATLNGNAVASNSAAAAIVGGNIQVVVNGNASYNSIETAINNLVGYSASRSAFAGDQGYQSTNDTPPSTVTLGSGASASGGLTQDAVFSVAGLNGAEVFSFGAGTSIANVAAGVNAQSDATGVTATVSGTTLQLKSSAYGTNAHVDVNVVSEASGGTIKAGLGGLSTKRDSGDNAVASVNGILANAQGNRLSINTASLDLSASVTAGFTGTASFTISGGGALFQLGPDVVSSQQARIGVTGVNTSLLGGVSGKLYQLGKGGSADLGSSSKINTAASIVGEAIDQITTLRGRLGAFQRTLLETNKNALNDTLVNLTDAESQIRDADFASESANLTRAQILVQSGTAVLQIAKSNPQNVLALLR